MTSFLILAQAVIAFLISTVGYDVLHYLLHLCLQSNNNLLKHIGNLHTPHHRFFPATLKFNNEWVKSNLIRHVVLEYLTQVSVTLLCLVFLNPIAVYLAIIFETCLFLTVCFYWQGRDLHHQEYTTLPSYRGGFFVSAHYHALHHVYPHNFYSGYIKLIDYVLGTALPLKGKQILLTGGTGALGSNMKILLENEGAIVTTVKYGVDYQYDHYDNLKSLLEKADILFLCHGSKYENAQQANCDSFIAIIEIFKSVRKRDLLPIEIWVVVSRNL